MNVRQRPVPANPAGEVEIGGALAAEYEAAPLPRLRIEEWGTPAFALAFGEHAEDFTTRLTQNSGDAVAYLISMGLLNDKGHLSSLYGGEV